MMPEARRTAENQGIGAAAKAAWDLRLYVAGQTPKSLQAFANLKPICEEHLTGKYQIEVIDPDEKPPTRPGRPDLGIAYSRQGATGAGAQNHRRPLVLLDVSMPGMSGQQTLQVLLTIQPDLDVLISTAYTETESMRVFAGIPVRGFVQKPYTARALARQVRAALVSRRSTRFGAD